MTYPFNITAKSVLEKLDIDLATATPEELQSALYALEDGEALKNLGLTDEDIPAIEQAYDDLQYALDCLKA